MFDLEKFVSDCKAAVELDPSHKSIHEIMKQAFSDPAGVMNAVGVPAGPGVKAYYRADNLTIVNVVWAPGAKIRPHNHNAWALIGIYTGQEDNTYWRRKDQTIEPAAEKTLKAGDIAPLGPDIIHSVHNPLDALTGAIHVYGGDFFAEHKRSEWDPDTLDERPYDMAKTLAMFAAQQAD